MKQLKSVLFLLFVFSCTAFAQEGLQTEKVDVDKIKERYWTKGEETELRVVQNRLYTKNGKFQLGLFAGTISTDPFLKVYNAGGSLGYHFTEYLAFNVTAWKFYVTSSSAARAFTQQTGGSVTNSNIPKTFFGGEFEFSPIYGKLSVLGRSIIYYDLHLLLGGGLTEMESGTYTTPLVGIGQQVFLSKNITLRLDYRMTYFKEKILQKYDPAKLNAVVGERDTFNSVITLGFNFLLDIF